LDSSIIFEFKEKEKKQTNKQTSKTHQSIKNFYSF